MTLEELQIALGESQLAATKLIQECQIRAAKYYEAQCKADMEKAEKNREISDIVADRTLIQSAIFMRPCMVHRPVLIQEDGTWFATYGMLVAEGPTPETAYQEFDRLWVGKDEL